MATLVAATIVSINPANELLACPDGAPVLLSSFANREVRLLQHGRSIVVEDDLDIRWEELAGVVVDEVIFFSRHTAVSNRPALTVHRIGNRIRTIKSFLASRVDIMHLAIWT
ncbi:D-aminoacyl-tRNA deacylase-like [Cucurbita moschata]|uniref:D-aminoacyl-tRNA deacylase-like n=1 Tax=Cucurbita moschata TaxID=3662 RepID=A0A6J1HAX2_CUCMO|nr:D-aminoacyl-tRNA deacylase-like [Cucurbita moschata]